MSKTHYGYDPRELELEVRGYTGNDEVICTCVNPEHHDSNPSACFNTSTGLFYCFACGYSANINQLSKLQNVVVSKQLLKQVKPDSEQLWKEFFKAPLALDNEYLKSRNVDNFDVQTFDIQETKNGVLFGFHNLKGDNVGYQMRQYFRKPKYLTFGERVLYDIRQLKSYNPYKPIYLTEGIFGMIKGHHSNFQTLATIGAMIKETTLKPILNWPNVYGVFDNDIAGSIAAIRLLKFVPQAKVILGFTADTNDWKDLHTSYVTTDSIFDIINLSNEPNKVRKYA